MPPDNFNALSSKRICYDCVGETFLSSLIKKDGTSTDCLYCGQEAVNTWTIGNLANAVETAFNDHMVRTEAEPSDWDRVMSADPDSDYSWYREGQETAEAIEAMTSIPSAAAQDVQAILADRYANFDKKIFGVETEFASDACYEEKRTDAQAWHWAWWSFVRALRTEARFFHREGAAILTRVFKDIDQLRTKPGHPAIVFAGPTRRINHLYRARVFQADEKLHEALCRPDQHIGAPPARLANAGRMNAKGISVFYGATNSAGALAEVRPPVGSKVAVANFEIIRPLRLLDLTALDHVRDNGSLFDPTLKSRLERVAFLQTLSAQLTRPVMPDDEAFDYLITQAIADFLATQIEPRLDGIIFASAQSKKGRNVVLFQAAALVAPMEFLQDTKISIWPRDSDEESSASCYWVREEPPTEPAQQEGGADGVYAALGGSTAGSDPHDGREPTLKVDPESVEVHHIEAVQVKSSAYMVRRIRDTLKH